MSEPTLFGAAVCRKPRAGIRQFRWCGLRAAAPGEADPTIAVNVSRRHLADPRVLADVAAALAASGLPPELLVLEVTETVLVCDQSQGHLLHRPVPAPEAGALLRLAESAGTV
jgi:EAL domain-containing protein (putative c-di-GMP-specific phosphodiesterase class I)